jgi:hypothetical protein
VKIASEKPYSIFSRCRITMDDNFRDLLSRS